jgi:hypothetical protein
VRNPAAAPLLEVGANGAYCNSTTELTCYAPEWAVLNYVEKELSTKNYISIRNEYVNDSKGQRTGTKTQYSEHLVGWGHWVGTTILLRPELRYDHSYDRPAYDSPCLQLGCPGTKKNQLTFAGDAIFFF